MLVVEIAAGRRVPPSHALVGLAARTGGALLESSADYPSFFLRRSILIGFKPILMHDPIGFLATGGSSLVEDKGLPHAHKFGLVIHRLVPSCKTCHGGSVRLRTGRRVLLVLVAEEVPIALLPVPNPTPLLEIPWLHSIEIDDLSDDV